MSEVKEFPPGTRICDLCNGKGSLLITIHDWFIDQPRTSEIVCFRCKGKGYIKEKEREEWTTKQE